MNGYYQDNNKITFDEGEVLVERYIRRNRERETYVTAKEVCEEFSLDRTMHNLIRINEALGNRLTEIDSSSTKSTKFKIEE